MDDTVSDPLGEIVLNEIINNVNGTSPSRLQDVTMENSNSLGFRSPPFITHQNETIPSSQGRSLREYEEQITTLRKENFNLKLRIYFIEEKNQAILNSSDGNESIFKENVDLKVAVESLRKELQEKQELLCQASRAMEVMEDNLKQYEELANQKIEELQQKIHFLEVEIENVDHNNQHLNNFAQDDVFFGISTHNLEKDNNVSKSTDNEIGKVQELQYLLQEKEKLINDIQTKFNKIEFEHCELKEKFEEANKTEEKMQDQVMLKSTIYEIKKELADKVCCLEETEEKLKDKSTAYDNACLIIRQLTNQKHELQLNNEATTTGEANQVVFEKEKEILNLKIKINNLNKDIISLKEHLRRKTMFLQTIVNQELWEKNREIERLTKLLSKDKSIEKNKSDINNIKLEQSFTEEQYKAALEQKNELQRHVNELIESISKNRVDHLYNQETEKLQQELLEANNRASQAYLWQKQCAYACETLTSHLEELAGFLSSLLNNKDTIINDDRRQVIKQAINRSLDVSKNLNMSLSMNESAVVDINSFSEVFDNEIFDNINNINESQQKINKNVDTLQVMRAKIRKENKDRNAPVLSEIQANSESETWSEPDRNVSQARIGLEGEKRRSISNSRNSISTDSEYQTQINSEKRSRISICKLEDMLNERDKKILQLQHSLVENDNILKKEKLNSLETIQQLSFKISELEIEISKKNMLIEDINRELNSKIHDIEEFDKAKINILVFKSKIETYKQDITEIKDRHRNEIESLKGEQAKLEYSKQSLQENFNSIMKEKDLLFDQTNVLKQEFEKREQELNFKLCNMQEQLLEFEQLKRDVKGLEIQSRKLQKNLDEATIQTSKIAMERTKAINEKSDIENKTRELEMEILKLSPRKISSKQSLILNLSDTNSTHNTDCKLNTIDVQNLKTVELSDDDGNNIVINLPHDCQKVEIENINIKRKYIKTKHALLETYNKLKHANQRKEQAERDIKQQILKTQNVLKDVRKNMDFELNLNINKAEDKENN